MTYRLRRGFLNTRVLQYKQADGTWVDDKQSPVGDVVLVSLEQWTALWERAGRADKADRRAAQQKAAREKREAWEAGEPERRRQALLEQRRSTPEGRRAEAWDQWIALHPAGTLGEFNAIYVDREAVDTAQDPAP